MACWTNIAQDLPEIDSIIFAVKDSTYYTGIVRRGYEETLLCGVSLISGQNICVPVNSLSFWCNAGTLIENENRHGIFPDETLLQVLQRNRIPLGLFLDQWDNYVNAGIDPSERILADFYIPTQINVDLTHGLQEVRDYYQRKENSHD